MAGGNQRIRDRLYVLLLGAVLAALAWVWGFETPLPDLMDDLAMAAGLRPPTGPFGHLWHAVAAPLCRTLGLPAAQATLKMAGHVSLGLLAVLLASLFEMMLPASLRRGEHVAAWWRVAVRFVLFQGVALCCCSEPVWAAFRWFSPSALQILLAVLAVRAFFVHLSTGRRAPLFASFALLGLLAADAPSGLVLLAGAVVALGVRLHLRKAGMLPEPEGTPFAGALMKWRLTLAFAAGALAGAALEIHAFVSCDGLAAFGWTWGDYLLAMPLAYVKALIASSSPAGVVLFVSVAVVPVVVELHFIRRATDDEKHLAYAHGMIFFVFALVALAQLSGAKMFWFWTLGGGSVRDCVLKCAAMFLCALSVVWTLAVFTIELYLRSFRRIETLRFPDAAEAEGAAEALASLQRMQRIVRTCLLAEPLLVFACVLPFRVQRLERAMLGVVADAAKETVEECRGVDYVFTDGGLDAAVELAAASAGRRLYALSMMGAPAGCSSGSSCGSAIRSRCRNARASWRVRRASRRAWPNAARRRRATSQAGCSRSMTRATPTTSPTWPCATPSCSRSGALRSSRATARTPTTRGTSGNSRSRRRASRTRLTGTTAPWAGFTRRWRGRARRNWSG